MIRFIIFSKDRPAQLDRLLRSIKEFYPECLYSVIYKASTPDYEYGYYSISEPAIREEDFKQDVINFMDKDCTAFLVDDMQFIDRFRAAGREYYEFLDQDDVACLSLRLYPGITYSYMKDMQLTPPPGTTWQWRGLKSYWGYPMSLDGHIFKTKDIKPIIERLEFSNPNELEGQLAINPIDKFFMMCYEKAKVINYPLNLVNDVCKNKNMNINPEYLNDSFLAGHRLALQYPKPHNSCHVELYPEWL